MDNVAEAGENPIPKKPFKKIKFGADRIINIALPHHLECLSNHCANIEKYKDSVDESLLHREQINALNAVRSLKTDIKELEYLNAQVFDDDQEKLATLIHTPLTKAVESLAQFLSLHSDLLVPLPQLERENSIPIDDIPKLVSDYDKKDYNFSSTAESSSEQIQLYVDPAVPNLKQWEKLKNEFIELNKLFKTFAASVFKQKEKVDTIENHVHEATENVLSGTRHLKRAVALNVALLPFAGAAVGSLLGPVGSVIGFHTFGSIAFALGGTAVGFTVGHKIKTAKIERCCDIELKAIEPESKCLSHSMPDLQISDLPESEESKKSI